MNDAHLWERYVSASPKERKQVAGQIVTHHIKFLQLLTNERAFRSWSRELRDELFQELCVAALELVPKFDTARETTFPTFVRKHTRGLSWEVEARRRPFTISGNSVWHSVGGKMSDRCRAQAEATRDAARLDMPDTPTVVLCEDPADTVVDADETVNRCRLARYALDIDLSPLERDLLTHRILGVSRPNLKVVGSWHGVSGETARLTEQKLLSRMRVRLAAVS